MSELDHLLWFIATAVMTVTVLVVGTLAAAGLLTGGERTGDAPSPPHADRGAEASDRPEPTSRQHYQDAA